MAKVMISLPDDFLRKIDRLAKLQHRTRSELIREALRVVMAREAHTRSSWTEALAPLRDLERHWVGRWNSTDVIRDDREHRHGRSHRR